MRIQPIKEPQMTDDSPNKEERILNVMRSILIEESWPRNRDKAGIYAPVTPQSLSNRPKMASSSLFPALKRKKQIRTEIKRKTSSLQDLG